MSAVALQPAEPSRSIGPASSNGQQAQESGKSTKKRKTSRACLSCQKAHLTCSDTRPCVRCHKRDEPCIEGEKKKARYLFTPEELEALKLAKQADPSHGSKSKRAAGSTANQQAASKQRPSSKPSLTNRKSGDNISTADGFSASTMVAQPQLPPVGPSSVHSGDQPTQPSLSSTNPLFPPSSSSRSCQPAEDSHPDPSRIIQPFTNLQAKSIPEEFKVFVGKNEYQRSPNSENTDQGWEHGKDTRSAPTSTSTSDDIRPSSINSRPSPQSLSVGFNTSSSTDDFSRASVIPTHLSGSSAANAPSPDPLTPGFIATLFGQHSDHQITPPQPQTGQPPPLQPPSHRPSLSSSSSSQQHQLIGSHSSYPSQPALFGTSQEFASPKHQFASSDVRSGPPTDSREDQDGDRSWPRGGDSSFWRTQLSLHQQRSSHPSNLSQSHQQPPPPPHQQQQPLPPSHPQPGPLNPASSTISDSSQIDPQMNRFSTSIGLDPQHGSVNHMQSTQPTGYPYGPPPQLPVQGQPDLMRNRTPPPMGGERPSGFPRQKDGLYPSGNEDGDADERHGTDGMKDGMDREHSRTVDGQTRRVADKRATQPYQYGKTYRRMIKFARERYGEMDAMRLVQSIAEFRPKMLSMSANHTTFQDILLEEALLASLSDLTSTLFPLTGTPTAIWRRTGEIVAASPELCILTEWAEGELLFGDREDEPEPEGGRVLDEWDGKHIWEIMEKQSFLEYGELFTKCAFEGTSPSFDLTCTLVSPDGRPVTCSACFSIKKDIFDLPSLIIGQFLPLL